VIADNTLSPFRLVGPTNEHDRRSRSRIGERIVGPAVESEAQRSKRTAEIELKAISSLHHLCGADEPKARERNPVAAAHGQYCCSSEQAWGKWRALRNSSPEELSRSWQARVDLFRDIESALGADPAGEPAQALARRWMAQLEDTSTGDPGVKAGLMKQWADRQHWTATLRWQIETST